MSRTPKGMPRIVTAFEARTQLGQIMRRASGEKQERFIVDRRGEPKVIIMGFKDFMRTIAPEPELLAAIRACSKRNKTDKLSMRAIDREISAVRKGRAKNAKPTRSA
jgi:hypothetical protein